MTLRANQKKIGTQREDSRPDVARSGRDSFMKRSGSIGHTSEDSRPDVARTGRASGTGQVSPSRGIGRGNADSKGGDAKRLDDGISSAGSSY